MRTLIYSAFVSVDGVVDSPGEGDIHSHRSAGWTYKDLQHVPDAYEIKGREMQAASALMFGRTSYEAFSSTWPRIEDFEVVRKIPKYVVSTSLREDQLVGNWGKNSILRTLDEVAALKAGDGGNILINGGSAGLARSLSDAGLIDRYHLLVFPVVLGAGKRMWSETDKDKQLLSLVESESYSNGVTKLVYDVMH
jgi:dihydrofolate reductase